MKKSFMKKLSLLLAVAVFLTTIAFGFSTNAEAASTRTKTISISEESQITLLKGAYFTLKPVITPANSTDYIRFVSSNPSVVKVNLYTGKLQAVNPGTATITVISKATKNAKNSDKANVKDTVVVKVVSNYASTSTWTNTLVNLPGSGTVKISTQKEVKITVPAGDFTNKYLVINVPKGDIVNNGVFKSISVYGIKNSTYYENTKGNTLNVFDKETRFVVTDKASVKALNLNAKNGTLKLIANGPVEAVNVKGTANTVNLVANNTLGPVALNAKTELNISGKTNAVEVKSTVEGSKVTSSVPVALTVSASTEVQLNAGAENSSIVNNSKAGAKVTLTNNTTAAVSITTADGSKTEVKAGATVSVSNDAAVTPTPTPTTGGTTGGDIGGGTITTPTPTPTLVTGKATVSMKDATATYTLPADIDKLESAKVTVNGTSYTVGKGILDMVVGFLDKESIYIDLWESVTGINNPKYTIDGKQIIVNGVGLTKEVSFGDTTFTVTVDKVNASITLKKHGGNNTYVLSKSGKRDLIITCASAPQNLNLVEFEVSYYK